MAVDVTLLVPNYNGAKYLRQTLESLVAQTYPDLQIVVVDNVSTDASVEIAESFAGTRLGVVRATPHISMAENWTRCVGLVQTPFFALCHSDDLYAPRHIETLVGLLKAHPKAFIAHCKANSMDEQGALFQAPEEKFKDVFWPKQDPCERPIADELRMLQKGNFIMAPSLVYRTEAVRKIGPFSPHYQFVTDWEYLFRGLLAGFTIVGTRERLMNYRRHASNETKRHEASLRRYREELELLHWIAEAAARNGLLDGKPDFSLVMNTVLANFSLRLSRADHAGARALHEFAQNEIPGFRRSLRDRAMGVSRRCGRAAGWSLVQAMHLYIALNRLLRPAPAHRS